MKLWAIWDVFKLKNSCLQMNWETSFVAFFLLSELGMVLDGFGHLVKLQCCVKSVSSGGYRWWEAICEQYKVLKTATLEIFCAVQMVHVFFGGVETGESTKTQAVVDFIQFP